MSKTIDFDAYRAEKKDENITIKAFGEKLELPPSPPLSTMEVLLGLYKKAGSEATVPEEEVITMLEALLGKEQYRKLSDGGLTVSEAEWLIQELWKQYNPEPEVKGDTKNKVASTSQKNGDS
jgi:hypothetical protein